MVATDSRGSAAETLYTQIERLRVLINLAEWRWPGASAVRARLAALSVSSCVDGRKRAGGANVYARIAALCVSSGIPAGHSVYSCPSREQRAQARVVEWQTRRSQKPLGETSCEFDPRLGHQVFGRPAHCEAGLFVMSTPKHAQRKQALGRARRKSLTNGARSPRPRKPAPRPSKPAPDRVRRSFMPGANQP